MRFAVAAGILANTVSLDSVDSIEIKPLNIEFTYKNDGTMTSVKTALQALQNSRSDLSGKLKEKRHRRVSVNVKTLRQNRGISPSHGLFPECSPNSMDNDADQRSCDKDSYCVKSVNSKLGGHCIPMSNDPPIQCDPTSVDPDVGLLSCGTNSFCVESMNSALGGICAHKPVEKKRMLDDGSIDPPPTGRFYVYCDPTSEFYGTRDCNCEEFNLEEKAGEIVCEYQYCFGEVSECCADACANITQAYRSNGVEALTLETCYSFTTPYEQSFCYGYNLSFGSDTLTCFGSFDDQQCSSCSIESIGCTRFDCTNTGLDDEFCLDTFYPPILTSCYAECSTCRICPNSKDGLVSNPGTYVFDSDYTCSYLSDAGRSGVLGGQRNATCIGIVESVQTECCSVSNESLLGVSQAPSSTLESPTPAPSFRTQELTIVPVAEAPTAQDTTPGPTDTESTLSPTNVVGTIPPIVTESTPAPSPSRITALPSAIDVLTEPTAFPETPSPSPGSTQAKTVVPTVRSTPTTAPTPLMPSASASEGPTMKSSSLATSPPTTKPDNLEDPPLTCQIRIQTPRCKELLASEAESIPCECADKCITFLDGAFEKCDDGSRISGAGTIVAGCTLDMAPEGIFNRCFLGQSGAGEDDASGSEAVMINVLSSLFPTFSLVFLLCLVY